LPQVLAMLAQKSMNTQGISFRQLDSIAISARASRTLQKILKENPEVEDILRQSTTVSEAVNKFREFAATILKQNPIAWQYANSESFGHLDADKIDWRETAALRLYDYAINAGSVFQDQNLRGAYVECHPIKYLWLAFHKGTGGALNDFFYDMLMLFRQLNGRLNQQKPEKQKIAGWMTRHPSGLDGRITSVRNNNKQRIIKLIIKKIDEGKLTSKRFCFNEGMTFDEKVAQANIWWEDHLFHLKFAVRTPELLHEMLNNSLSPETRQLLDDAKKAGIPFFVNPYYLSLLNVTEPDFAIGSDLPIRDYILYSKSLIKEFGHIVAWEKEDKVVHGEPNAAGWLLPKGNNIHRRYPEVAIMIPDTAGRACGGLCVSCQRMYDFQSGRLNFDLEQLLPKENWPFKLNRLMKYFEEDPHLCDILITGGDALMSSDKSLKIILDAVIEMALRKQENNASLPPDSQKSPIHRVRLGTRLPVYLPQRITPQLAALLADFKINAARAGIRQFVIQTHFETAMEVTPDVVVAINRLQRAGWIITNQHVFTVSSSRRGHLARLRQVLNELGVLPYYTFSVKGFMENSHNFATNARLLQELKEEKIAGYPDPKVSEEIMRLSLHPETMASELPKLAGRHQKDFLSSDRSVLNLPGVGKSLSYRTISITRHGRRVLLFDHDHSRNHSKIIEEMGQIPIIESKSVLKYLRQLDDMGEESSEYESIWGYSVSKTESLQQVFRYPSSKSSTEV